MKKGSIEECIDEASSLLKGLANSNRLMILCALLEREQCVNDLLDQIPLSQPLISQHLKRLKDEEIVSTERDGQRIYYSISDPLVRKLLKLLEEKFRG